MYDRHEYQELEETRRQDEDFKALEELYNLTQIDQSAQFLEKHGVISAQQRYAIDSYLEARGYQLN